MVGDRAARDLVKADPGDIQGADFGVSRTETSGDLAVPLSAGELTERDFALLEAFNNLSAREILIMLSQKYSQNKVAKMLGKSQGYISGIINERSVPGDDFGREIRALAIRERIFS